MWFSLESITLYTDYKFLFTSKMTLETMTHHSCCMDSFYVHSIEVQEEYRQNGKCWQGLFQRLWCLSGVRSYAVLIATERRLLPRSTSVLLSTNELVIIRWWFPFFSRWSHQQKNVCQILEWSQRIWKTSDQCGAGIDLKRSWSEGGGRCCRRGG